MGDKKEKKVLVTERFKENHYYRRKYNRRHDFCRYYFCGRSFRMF